jgi:hypothetical protein
VTAAQFQHPSHLHGVHVCLHRIIEHCSHKKPSSQRNEKLEHSIRSMNQYCSAVCIRALILQCMRASTLALWLDMVVHSVRLRRQLNPRIQRKQPDAGSARSSSSFFRSSVFRSCAVDRKCSCWTFQVDHQLIQNARPVRLQHPLWILIWDSYQD